MTEPPRLISRRRLLGLAAGAVAAAALRPWPLDLAPAAAQVPEIDPDLVDPTLEAFADTLIPGERRSMDDRAIAGEGTGPGAVEAGAVDMLRFGPAGIGPLVPAVAAGLSLRATGYALEQGLVLDPLVAPWVALEFDDRTELAIRMLDGTDPDRALWEAVAALVFLAFHTAGHLPTATAVRAGHPGLASIGFPQPDADDLWRFPDHSYGLALGDTHPATTRGGHPA